MEQLEEGAPQGNDDSVKEFLLAEYEQVAAAYFATVSLISQFFQYYILIISIPVSVAAVTFDKLKDWHERLRANSAQTGLVTTVVVLALLFVMLYIANLRADSLLYARHINGLRRHFAAVAGNDGRYRDLVLVLPQNPALPRYWETSFFLFVVLVFSLFDSLILCLGWWLHIRRLAASDAWLILVFGTGVAMHLLSYRWLTSYREQGYLSDGVTARA